MRAVLEVACCPFGSFLGNFEGPVADLADHNFAVLKGEGARRRPAQPGLAAQAWSRGRRG